MLRRALLLSRPMPDRSGLGWGQKFMLANSCALSLLLSFHHLRVTPIKTVRARVLARTILFCFGEVTAVSGAQRSVHVQQTQFGSIRVPQRLCLSRPQLCGVVCSILISDTPNTHWSLELSTLACAIPKSASGGCPLFLGRYKYWIPGIFHCARCRRPPPYRTLLCRETCTDDDRRWRRVKTKMLVNAIHSALCARFSL